MADVLPFLGDLVGMGTAVVALALALPLSLATIAIAWVVYRPLVGIGLIVVGVGGFFGVRHLVKQMREGKQPAAGTPPP